MYQIGIFDMKEMPLRQLHRNDLQKETTWFKDNFKYNYANRVLITGRVINNFHEPEPEPVVQGAQVPRITNCSFLWASHISGDHKLLGPSTALLSCY